MSEHQETAKIEDELYLQLSGPLREQAFRQLYDRYSGPLFRFIYRFTGNQEHAEEILHDVFTQLLQQKYRTDENSNLKSWLYTLAKNKGLNHLKKSSQEMAVEAPLKQTVDQLNIEHEFSNRQISRQLALAEQRLPSELQLTWNLRKQGLDYQEIAQRLAIPVGTVKSRFHRLVEYLKKEIDL